MNLPEYSVRRRVTTLMVFLAALVVGAVCLWQLPIDLFPEMELPVVSVITVYEGAAPEDVETKVTDPLERSLSTVPELKHLASKSKEGVSVITLSFEWGTNLDARSNEVRDAVGLAKMLLPDDADEPLVYKFDVSRFPIMFFGVTARESYPRIEKILDDEVVKPLKRLAGVGSAAAFAPLNRQVNVELDRERLAAYGLTPQDVVRAIAAENKDTPAGNVKVGLTDYLVRVPGEFSDVAPLRQIALTTRNGSVVRVSDVATVEDAFDEQQFYISVNGDRAAGLMVQKQSGANTVAVARAVRARLDQLRKRLPPDVRIIDLFDSSEDIETAINDLSSTLRLGGALTMLVVLVFLRRWRATVVIGLTLPFSLIVGVIAIYFLGYTINMMSLFAMIIAVGMIVDNAIVILENITRHREEGERPSEGAVYGTSEVAMAVTASTLTTMAIFLPIVFVKGVTGIFFTEFAIVVCVILLASLFTALTMTPMLTATLLRRERFGESASGGFFRWSERIFDGMGAAYERSLGWALGHRKTVVVSAVVLFAGSLLLWPLLGTEFMPEEDKAILQATVHLPVGTRVEETAETMKALDRLIREVVPENEREAVYASCGTREAGIGSAFGEEGSHIGEFGVKLVPKVERTRHVREIAAALRERIEDQKGLLRIERYRIESGDPMSGLLLGGELPLTVNIIGDDLETTDRVAERVKEVAQRTPGTVDVSVSRAKGRPEIWVEVDRAGASSLGLNVSDIGDTLRTSLHGRTASKYRIRGDEYDIYVRMRPSDRADLNDILATPVRLLAGPLVRTEALATTTMRLGPVEIERKDQGRIVNVMGNVHKRSLGEVVADIEKEIGKMEVPPGVEVLMAGQTEEMREAFFWLGIALVVGAILVYMVMASQFESLRDPFVVMFSVPFAFTGAIWAIYLGGHHISIVVFVGLLLLIGVVVNNAILLVDYSNVLRARGLPLFDAVRKAGRARLRPVLMTALTTIGGLVPMAFGRGQGSEVWNPLGLTVMGGLLVSTFVTLILVPTIYSIFETIRARTVRR